MTEDHLVSVEKFFDGSLDSSSETTLEFLDHVEGFGSDRASRTAITLALACTEDPCQRSVEALLKRGSLGEVLAHHINRYLRFPSSFEQPPVSFRDFSAQPRLRFLSQLHRVEAWMCFMFSKTEPTRRLEASGQSWPVGFPIAACFTGISKNIHSAASPGGILSASLERIITAEEPMELSIPVPQYMDPGRGDVVTHVQEIAERRAISGAELAWEDMFAQWENGPEIEDAVITPGPLSPSFPSPRPPAPQTTSTLSCMRFSIHRDLLPPCQSLAHANSLTFTQAQCCI